MRVFDITVNGLKSWREPADERVALEVQHELATERFVGSSVRVVEVYIQDPKPAPEKPETDSGRRGNFNSPRTRII